MRYYLTQRGGTTTLQKSDSTVPGALRVPEAMEGDVLRNLQNDVPFRIVNGAMEAATTKRPSLSHTYDFDAGAWVDSRTMADIKAQQWTKIKQSRTAAESSGFTWDGSTFDSDAISQQRITGAVTLAQMNSSFTIDWTLADNSVRTLSAADMIAVGAAVGTHVATVFAKGQALRAQIEAATTQAEVEAVVW